MLKFWVKKELSGSGFFHGFKPKLSMLPLSIGLLLASQPAQAEDPLLGRIKAIKCVGCEAGKVTLVIHDPIEVRDYDITITDVDYGKIITPLPGKMVYDGANSCFYWNEAPKPDKKSPAVVKKVVSIDSAGSIDSTPSAKSDSIATPTPTVEVKPSKCIPYQKAAPPKVSKPD